MPISNQQKAQQAIERLEKWIDSQPEMPIYNGRLNKTAICQIIKIPKSTIGSNGEIKAIFDSLESSLTSYKMQDVRGEKERQLQKNVDRLEVQLELAEDEIRKLKTSILINEHLLETGRIIDD